MMIVSGKHNVLVHNFKICRLIAWCLTPTFTVFQLQMYIVACKIFRSLHHAKITCHTVLHVQVHTLQN